MDKHLCKHCGLEISPKELKLWRWAGWTPAGTAPTAPQKEIMPGKRKSEADWWDFAFHKDCFGEWIENRNGFLQDLDRPANNCKFFVRTGSSNHGYYIRDDKKHAVFGGWTEADILGTALFPAVVGEINLDFDFIKIKVTDDTAFLNSFRAFLQKHGWFGPQWYEPRKPFEIKEIVYNRRTFTD